MTIEELRGRITEIDKRLVKDFDERMRVALEIGKYKKEHNLPVFDPARERDVLNRQVAAVDEDMAMYVKFLYSTLFDISRSYQQRYITQDRTELTNHIARAIENTPKVFPKQAVVACQGVEGAYSQQACDKLFALPSIMYFKRFEGVFQAIDSGLCRYGVLPIENSSYGSVIEVHDLMRKYRFSIVRGVKLKIDHRLLAKPGVKLTDIREVISHEQAIGQCSEFLKKLAVKVTVCENTARAAQMVSQSDRRDIAAISSGTCAALYGLSVLQNSVANSDSNFTRFICISKDLEIYPGANRMSLMLNVQHKPGALYNMIAKFSALGLNLTKLESRPIVGSDFEFMFYFDLDASVYDEAALQLLSELDEGPDTFTYLGSYSEI